MAMLLPALVNEDLMQSMGRFTVHTHCSVEPGEHLHGGGVLEVGIVAAVSTATTMPLLIQPA